MRYKTQLLNVTSKNKMLTLLTCPHKPKTKTPKFIEVEIGVSQSKVSVLALSNTSTPATPEGGTPLWQKQIEANYFFARKRVPLPPV